MSLASNTCALCLKNSELRQSHILPAFSGRSVKRTSAIPSFRSSQDPTRSVQDTLKIKMLCEGCERLFSRHETQFAKRVFHPLREDCTQRLQYEEWLLQFCVSLSWRVLTYAVGQGSLRECGDARGVDRVQAALDTWRRFLLGRAPNVGEFTQHTVCFQPIRREDLEIWPPNINRDFFRAQHIAVESRGACVFTYAKMLGIAIFGRIDGKQGCLSESEVHSTGGAVEPRHPDTLPWQVRDYLIERATKHREVSARVPSEDQKRTEDRLLADPPMYRESETARAQLLDFERSGNAAFRRDRALQGGNVSGVESFAVEEPEVAVSRTGHVHVSVGLPVGARPREDLDSFGFRMTPRMAHQIGHWLLEAAQVAQTFYQEDRSDTQPGRQEDSTVPPG